MAHFSNSQITRRRFPTKAGSGQVGSRLNAILALSVCLCLQAACLPNDRGAAAEAADEAGAPMLPPVPAPDINSKDAARDAAKEDLKDDSKDSADEIKVQPAANPLNEISAELGKKLQDLESHFFGHIYSNEAVERRVVRLERFVFGTETGGPFSTRIDHVASSLNVSDPDGTKREIKYKPKDTPKPQEAAANEAESSQPIPTAVAPVVSAPAEDSGFPPRPEPAIDEATRRPIAITTPVSVASKPKVLVLQVSKGTFTTAGKPGEIIRELDQAIRIHPSDPELLFERAKAYIQMDKYSNALNDLSDAIQDQPNKADYYIARAWCYKKLGNSYLAADDIKQARFVDPSLPPQIDLLQTSKAIGVPQTE